MLKAFVFVSCLVPTMVIAECPEVPNTSEACNLCGEGKCVGNPEGVVDFTSFGQGAFPCGDLEVGGLQGAIPASFCGFVQNMAGGCDCNPFGIGTPTAPVFSPVFAPSITPPPNTDAPTSAPTAAPTPAPTTAPTAAPTSEPTPDPTPEPTPDPTLAPTTAFPTRAPTSLPTPLPTAPVIPVVDDEPATNAPVQSTIAPVQAPAPEPVPGGKKEGKEGKKVNTKTKKSANPSKASKASFFNKGKL